MSRQKIVEVWVGAFVLMSLIALSVIAFKVSNYQGLQERATYEISGLFSNIGGLKVRAPVKISGVVVGRIKSIEVDAKTYQALVKMDIYQDFNQLSSDTSGVILTSGLLGDQYVGLEPGGSDELLKNGDRLELTQPALVLEELIGQFLTKFSGDTSKP
ncbi:outer membrane lipid asymmetry maintenance protein MlaD [Thiosulfativibrio zosterae]|uniref:Outer membrane lipid asymmetry maintenance protein MlaD n=1 Tax=Thiosulfativibrio zosterae TaxID=2675053 RepID=A0A6F8PM97_9GAMM|nr:outer membrane lipid asymmetry maintenance protein MlaD [Thiosulfativibrio zosterae]BBP43215.1 outer membrane lipid asymmetry maintenance protein MlaD [Thiosulfativibrio zosterae]